MWILQLSAIVLGAGIVLGVVWRTVEGYFERKEFQRELEKQLQEAEALQAANKTE